MNSPRNITLESEDSISAIIALGANIPSKIGAPIETLKFARESLSELCVGEPVASSDYQTEALGCIPGSPDFINAVVVIPISVETDPTELLQRLQHLERHCGRDFQQPANSPRPLDLDILCFGELILSRPQLVIPHPRAHERRFVLEPLAEIAPELVLPGQAVSVSKLLDAMPSSPRVRKLNL